MRMGRAGEESPARPPPVRAARARYAVAQRGTQRLPPTPMPHVVSWHCCPAGHSAVLAHSGAEAQSRLHNMQCEGPSTVARLQPHPLGQLSKVPSQVSAQLPLARQAS